MILKQTLVVLLASVLTLASCGGGPISSVNPSNPTNPTGSNNPSNPGFKKIYAGDAHTCGIGVDSSTYCWGANTDGQLGIGNTTNLGEKTLKLVNINTKYSSVNTAGSFTCGLDLSSLVYCWGSNFSGQLGTGDKTSTSSPKQIVSGIKFKSIGISSNRRICALDIENSAYCWGSLNTESVTSPRKVATTLKFTEISDGASHTCTKAIDDYVYCWGSNVSGEIGNSSNYKTYNYTLNPVVVINSKSLRDVSTGWFNTCALDTIGKAYCWGSNYYGQLGNDSTSESYIPQAVQGDHIFLDIKSGYGHTCGISNNGSIYCWGWNADGQLGIGNKINTSTPILVKGGLTYSAMAVGLGHTCGLSGTAVYCWGSNQFGQLGNNSFVDSDSPVKVK